MLNANKDIFLKISGAVNALLVLGFVAMLVVNTVLGMALYGVTQTNSRTLLPPTVSKSFTVSDSQVDEPYLHMMADYFLYLRTNITPGNVDRRFSQLLNYASESAWPVVQPMLVNESEIIKKNNISSHFEVRNIQVSLAQMLVRVTGVLHKTVSARALTPQPRVYQLKMSYTQGYLELDHITREATDE